jgi:hypothetical protein
MRRKTFPLWIALGLAYWGLAGPEWVATRGIPAWIGLILLWYGHRWLLRRFGRLSPARLAFIWGLATAVVWGGVVVYLGLEPDLDDPLNWLAFAIVSGVLPGQRGEPESVEGPDDEERMDRVLQAALETLGLQITLWGSLWTCIDVEEICLENPDDEEAIAKMVEYLRADGAEEDRWLGPFRKQFYWDASRRWAVTRANLIGHSDDRMWYDPEPDGPTLYIDVGVVEDAGVTWHGLWVHTFFWDRALEHGRLTVSIDGEPIELQMRSHAGCIDRSELYGRPVFEQKSIFNAPPGLLRKIARARTVRVRLDGQDEAIEKQFTRRNIACVRKFVRDNLVGEELRQDP